MVPGSRACSSSSASCGSAPPCCCWSEDGRWGSGGEAASSAAAAAYLGVRPAWPPWGLGLGGELRAAGLCGAVAEHSWGCDGAWAVDTGDRGCGTGGFAVRWGVAARDWPGAGGGSTASSGAWGDCGRTRGRRDGAGRSRREGAREGAREAGREGPASPVPGWSCCFGSCSWCCSKANLGGERSADAPLSAARPPSDDVPPCVGAGDGSGSAVRPCTGRLEVRRVRRSTSVCCSACWIPGPEVPAGECVTGVTTAPAAALLDRPRGGLGGRAAVLLEVVRMEGTRARGSGGAIAGRAGGWTATGASGVSSWPSASWMEGIVRPCPPSPDPLARLPCSTTLQPELPPSGAGEDSGAATPPGSAPSGPASSASEPLTLGLCSDRPDPALRPKETALPGAGSPTTTGPSQVPPGPGAVAWSRVGAGGPPLSLGSSARLPCDTTRTTGGGGRGAGGGGGGRGAGGGAGMGGNSPSCVGVDAAEAADALCGDSPCVSTGPETLAPLSCNCCCCICP